jgi:hypothetical protein
VAGPGAAVGGCRRRGLDRLLHLDSAAFHNDAYPHGEGVWQHISSPDQPARPAFWEDLERRMVVVGWRARALDDGVGQATGGVVERDDQLADHVPVGKGQDPLAALDPAAGDAAGQQALVHGTDITEHVPDMGRVDHDFVADGGHDAWDSFHGGPGS